MSELIDDSYGYDPDDGYLSTQWEKGYHTTKDYNKIKLSLMTDTHIENTIKYFREKEDVSALEDELKMRDLIRNKQ